MMCDYNGKSLQDLIMENRLEHEYVRQMHAAGIRVIQDDDIAIKQIFAEFIHHRADRVRHRA